MLARIWSAVLVHTNGVGFSLVLARNSRIAPSTLVEMLVVIGIIAVLISLLLPALNKALAQAEKVQCMSNLMQIGNAMLIYAEENNGFLFPPKKGYASPPKYVDGTHPQQLDVWPFYLFKLGSPPVMLCPTDDPDPIGGHSYIANGHLYDHTMEGGTVDYTYSSTPPGISPSDVVVVVGEKAMSEPDYYMDLHDYDSKVDLYRHGPLLGSNYLMLDMHMDTLPPPSFLGGLDPWDPVGAGPTTVPSE